MRDVSRTRRGKQEQRDAAASATQFIEKIEKILDEYEEDPDKLNSKIRDALKEFRKT